MFSPGAHRSCHRSLSRGLLSAQWWAQPATETMNSNAWLPGLAGTSRDMPAMARIEAAPAPAPSPLKDFARDLDNMFAPPVPLPSPEQRARMLVDSIDWSQPLIVLWIPGTSGHDVPRHVAELLRRARGPAAHAMPYQATWQLRDSVPDGEATLRATLELVALRKRPGQKVVLLGESQGAWIISSVLREPRFAKLINRASLVAHPGMSPAHVHESTSTKIRLTGPIREFNSTTDVVTKEVGSSAETALDVVDSFARLDIGRALRGAVRIMLTNPALLQALVASQLFRVKGEKNPHESQDLMTDAIAWILGRPSRSGAK